MNNPTDPSASGAGVAPLEKVSEGDILESETWGIKNLRWTRSAGQEVVHQAAVNRALNASTPLFVRCGNEVLEAKPSELYIVLEQLHLEGASDQSIRACALLRGIVAEDIVAEVH